LQFSTNPKEYEPSALIARRLPVTELLIRENFLTAQDCRSFIACYEENRPNLSHDTHEYWRDRVLYFNRMPEQHRAIKLRIRELIYRQIELLHRHFAYSGPLYPETANLVSWPKNLEMAPHVDQDEGFAQRMFAAVGYLNDDYEGGEIYFPEINESIKPKAGMLVAFHCGPRHRHGVRPIRGKVLRYTFPTWFTEREESIDRSLVDYR
jgi:predicted 2-oxoglutarate/Fe(II)-dependent dioxygenase YbiX